MIILGRFIGIDDLDGDGGEERKKFIGAYLDEMIKRGMLKQTDSKDVKKLLDILESLSSKEKEKKNPYKSFRIDSLVFNKPMIEVKGTKSQIDAIVKEHLLDGYLVFEDRRGIYYVVGDPICSLQVV